MSDILQRHAIVLDLETKFSFQEVNNNIALLGVSCVGIYDYSNGQFTAFLEHELDKLFPLLEHASLIIGFNINRFDMRVLSAYYLGDLFALPRLDLLQSVKQKLGRRISLNELAKTTLGRKKSGHGLLALEYYQQGNFEKLKRYCLDDVRITRDLYEYGKKYRKVYFRGRRGREQVEINWRKWEDKEREISLTLGI